LSDVYDHLYSSSHICLLILLHLYLSVYDFICICLLMRRKGNKMRLGQRFFFLSRDLHLFLFFVLGSKIFEAASAEIVLLATVIPRILMYHSHEPHSVCFF
jgi:hypothetical protein